MTPARLAGAGHTTGRTAVSRRGFLRAATLLATSATGLPALTGRAASPSLPHDHEGDFVMPFSLPKLPYSIDALAPVLSRETLEIHHSKHHAGYVENLNRIVAGTDWVGKSLEAIVRGAGPGSIFNNAAQHWNHSFYWECLSPGGGGKPRDPLADRIDRAFGSFDAFRGTFREAALGLFGSGWAWLVRTQDDELAIVTTPNAENPLLADQTPLLTCDVWEHAYYIDYRNARARYVDAFWDIVDWKRVGER